MTTPRCRFAPSPTGLLHVGGARTALFNLLFARSVNGRHILRIEDTDRVRSSLESERRICEDLKWLGIAWDEGPDVGGPGAPYRQSERLDLYRAAAKVLLAKGAAFEAWETREELTVMRAAGVAADGGWRYRRPRYSDADVARFKAEGREPVLRFDTAWKGAREPVTVFDRILGEVNVGPNDLEDFVIVKADGFPTYHFAVVVDDHHMKVTHVLRAQEHLLNTVKHVVLYDALEWDVPEHGHMPVIHSMTGGKMSKRDKARAARLAARESGLDNAVLAARSGLTEDTVQRFRKKKIDDVDVAAAIAGVLGAELPEIDVMDFRRAGHLPEALVNYLALLGWSPGEDREVMSLEEMCERFTIERVGKTAAKFDREKLKWMGGVYMRDATIDRLYLGLQDYCALNPESPLVGADEALQRALLEMYQPRIQTFGDLEESAGFFFSAPVEYGPAKALKKHLFKGGLERLALTAEVLHACPGWTAEHINDALKAVADTHAEGKLGLIAQPLRIALTGRPVSPSIDVTLVYIGREETLARIDTCLAHFKDA